MDSRGNKITSKDFLIIKSFDRESARRIFTLLCEEFLKIPVEKGLGIVGAWSMKNITFTHVIKLCDKKMPKRRLFLAIEREEGKVRLRSQSKIRKEKLLDDFALEDIDIYKPNEDHLNLE